MRSWCWPDPVPYLEGDLPVVKPQKAGARWIGVPCFYALGNGGLMGRAKAKDSSILHAVDRAAGCQPVMQRGKCAAHGGVVIVHQPYIVRFVSQCSGDPYGITVSRSRVGFQGYDTQTGSPLLFKQRNIRGRGVAYYYRAAHVLDTERPLQKCVEIVDAIAVSDGHQCRIGWRNGRRNGVIHLGGYEQGG